MSSLMLRKQSCQVVHFSSMDWVFDNTLKIIIAAPDIALPRINNLKVMVLSVL